MLAPGGRIGISDIVADDGLSPQQRAERGSCVGCVAGALAFEEYRSGLAAAGFTGISLTPTHQVAEGMHSVIVRAAKPAAQGTGAAGPAPAHAAETARPAEVTAARPAAAEADGGDGGRDCCDSTCCA